MSGTNDTTRRRLQLLPESATCGCGHKVGDHGGLGCQGFGYGIGGYCKCRKRHGFKVKVDASGRSTTERAQ